MTYSELKMEREAVQDVARLMLTWASRLGGASSVAQRFEACAEDALRQLTVEGQEVT